MSNIVPTKIVDKNGKLTTVHKKQDLSAGVRSPIPGKNISIAPKDSDGRRAVFLDGREIGKVFQREISIINKLTKVSKRAKRWFGNLDPNLFGHGVNQEVNYQGETNPFNAAQRLTTKFLREDSLRKSKEDFLNEGGTVFTWNNGKPPTYEGKALALNGADYRLMETTPGVSRSAIEVSVNYGSYTVELGKYGTAQLHLKGNTFDIDPSSGELIAEGGLPITSDDSNSELLAHAREFASSMFS